MTHTMGSIVGACCLAVLSSTPAGEGVAAARGLRDAPTVAVVLTSEITSSAIGLEGGYQLRVGESRVALTPHAAGELRLFSAGDSVVLRGWAVGLRASIGGNERLVLDGGWGTVTVEQLELHGASAATRAARGPIFSVGYEHVTAAGWLLRAGLVAGFRLLPRSEVRRLFHLQAVLALGYELW